MGTVVDLFSRRSALPPTSQIIRIEPEHDDVMAIRRDANGPRRLRIACWALRDNGEAEALIPWHDGLKSSRSFTDPLGGEFDGFIMRDSAYESDPDYILKAKRVILEAGALVAQGRQVVPDFTGTHAVIITEDEFALLPVASWVLADGQVTANLLTKSEDILETQISKKCDTLAKDHPGFRYYVPFELATYILDSEDPDEIFAKTFLG